MAQPLKPTAVLAEDLGQVPSTSLGWHTILCNFNSRGPDALFLLLDED